jgi:DNA polymerase-3 subunit delta'
MIPLLILSDDKKQIKKYVDDMKSDSMFFEILPSTKEFSIDDIKNLLKETKVFNKKNRIYFLSDFNLSSIPAQNSFLKLLEEPPSNVQFILSAQNKNSLLPTIISRVKIIKLQSKSKTLLIQKFVTDFISDVYKKNETTIPMLAFKVTDSDSAKNVLLQMISVFQSNLATDAKATIVLKKILWLNSLLDSNNLNPQLTVDEALIFISKTYRMK